jgi:hypothetical protein
MKSTSEITALFAELDALEFKTKLAWTEAKRAVVQDIYARRRAPR